MTQIRKALIFGAASLSGVSLARELRDAGYIVTGADIKENVVRSLFDNYYPCDITDAKQVEYVMAKSNPTHIFDLVDGRSFATWKRPQYGFLINEVGAINIFEAAKNFLLKPKILLAGSSEEYGEANRPLFENDAINPNTPYGLAKAVQEKLAEIYRNKYNLDIFCVRQFDILGVGANRHSVVDLWCEVAAGIKEGTYRPVMYVGDLNVYRDYLDIRDLVAAYRLIIESSNSEEIYNVGYGISYTLKDILDYIISLTGKEVRIEIDPKIVKEKAGENKMVKCDHSKITKSLGWEPQHVIFDTIKQIFQSYLTK